MAFGHSVWVISTLPIVSDPGSARNDDKPSTLTIVSGPGSARNGSARNDDNKPFYVDEQSEVLLESQLQSIGRAFTTETSHRLLTISVSYVGCMC